MSDVTLLPLLFHCYHDHYRYQINQDWLGLYREYYSSVSHPWGRDSAHFVKFDVYDKSFYGQDDPQSVVLLCVYCVHWDEICPSLAI